MGVETDKIVKMPFDSCPTTPTTVFSIATVQNIHTAEIMAFARRLAILPGGLGRATNMS